MPIFPSHFNIFPYFLLFFLYFSYYYGINILNKYFHEKYIFLNIKIILYFICKLKFKKLDQKKLKYLEYEKRVPPQLFNV